MVFDSDDDPSPANWQKRTILGFDRDPNRPIMGVRDSVRDGTQHVSYRLSALLDELFEGENTIAIHVQGQCGAAFRGEIAVGSFILEVSGDELAQYRQQFGPSLPDSRYSGQGAIENAYLRAATEWVRSPFQAISLITLADDFQTSRTESGRTANRTMPAMIVFRELDRNRCYARKVLFRQNALSGDDRYGQPIIDDAEAPFLISCP